MSKHEEIPAELMEAAIRHAFMAEGMLREESIPSSVGAYVGAVMLARAAWLAHHGCLKNGCDHAKHETFRDVAHGVLEAILDVTELMATEAKGRA